MRLRFIVEGRTEANFVSRVLIQHLAQYGVYAAKPQLVATRNRGAGGVKFSGGMTSWARTKAEICRLMKGDAAPDCRFTTMFDYYALPTDFPGLKDVSAVNDAYSRVELVERRIGEEIGDARLIPYIQLHEFESLVFSDLSKIGVACFGADAAIADLKRQSEEFASPELVDGGLSTAPSKRLLRALACYDKPNDGVMIVESIGLNVLRRKCMHFSKWLGELESLVGKGCSI